MSLWIFWQILLMIQGVVMNKFKRIKVYPLVSVQDVAKVHYGKSLKAEERVLSGLIPVFGSSGKIGTHDKTLVEYPTIIIGRKGSVGKVTYAEQGGWPIDTTVFYTEIIKPKKLNLRFFFYALKNSNLERWTITTSIPGINRDDIYKTKIPLPPIDEQRRIAAILDQADAIRRKRQQAIALTDELLRSTFLEMFGDPVINPKGWEEVTVNDIVSAVRDGPHVSPKYSQEGIPILSSRNIRPGKLIMEDVKYVSYETYLDLVKRFKPQCGDVLLTKGVTTGFAKTVDWDWPFTIWVHVAVLRPTDKIIPEFLETALNSPNCYEQSQKYTHGIANKDLGLTRIRKIKLSW